VPLNKSIRGLSGQSAPADTHPKPDNDSGIIITKAAIVGQSAHRLQVEATSNDHEPDPPPRKREVPNEHIVFLIPLTPEFETKGRTRDQPVCWRAHTHMPKCCEGYAPGMEMIAVPPPRPFPHRLSRLPSLPAASPPLPIIAHSVDPLTSPAELPPKPSPNRSGLGVAAPPHAPCGVSCDERNSGITLTCIRLLNALPENPATVCAGTGALGWSV